jgi:N-acetylglucosaminyl-diphospho-decaprenol L-rhamnosyltransferase
MTDVPVVVVDFHAGEHLRSLIDSLAGEPVAKVVVVDNSMSGAAREPLRHHTDLAVEIIEALSNGGFGAGVNLGMAGITDEFAIISNPDVVVEPGAIEALRAVARADKSLAVVGPAIFEADGKLHQSARAFPSLRRSGVHAFVGLVAPRSRAAERYRQENWNRSAGQYVDWVSGAFFLVRREAFEAVGGFDERFFLYVEEVDLCWRLRRAGWTVAYAPTAKVTHTGGVSGAGHPYRTAAAHHRSLWRFVRTTSGDGHRWLLCLALAGIGLRFVLACGRIVLERLPHRKANGFSSSDRRRRIPSPQDARRRGLTQEPVLATPESPEDAVAQPGADDGDVPAE